MELSKGNYLARVKNTGFSGGKRATRDLGIHTELIIEATNSVCGRVLMAMELFGLIIEVLIEVIIEESS